MEEQIQSPRTIGKPFLFLIIFLVVACLGVAGYYFSKNPSPSNSSSAVSTVPYFGVFNLVGEGSRFDDEVEASLAMILRYWDSNADLQNFVATSPAKYKYATARSLEDLGYSTPIINAYVESSGKFTAKTESLNLDQVTAYIGQGVPLFTYIKVSGPQKNYYVSPVVITGVDFNKKALIAQHYWFGTNYAISFANFQQLTGTDLQTQAYKFLVIKPTDLTQTHKTTQSTPSRTALMDTTASLFGKYSVALNFYRQGSFTESSADFLAISQDPGFSSFPTLFQEYTYQLLADSYLGTTDLSNALIYAQKAVDMNHGLNVASGDWLGTNFPNNSTDHMGESGSAYQILGDILLAENNVKDALSAYKTALSILPNNALLIEKINNVTKK